MKQQAMSRPAKQRGVVLLVALIMLLMVTLMVVAGFNITQTNLQVMHNLESRSLARHAANSAIEQAISSDLFLKGGNVFASSCEQANRQCYDLNGDGTNDVNVDVVVNCTIVSPLSNKEVLQFSGLSADSSDAVFGGGAINTKWASCLGGVGGGGVATASLCSSVVWDFVATAVDVQTGAQSVVRQGVFTASDSNVAETVCD